MSELTQLIEQEIPDGRQNLQENFSNLEKVAQYCQENYIQAKDKKKALEETKNFTTHSLASVAYQINNLATNFLKLLDLQQSQLAEMESNVNHLAQTVNIHKEKVARREIGVLTTNRSTTRPLGVKNGIIFPEHGERPTKYQRKNIDYTQLDDVGHGVKTHTSSSAPSQSRSSSISSGGSSQAPTLQPPTPPQLRGSIGKASGQQIQGNYRTPAPIVAPPTVPGVGPYASREQIQRDSLKNTPYAPGTPPVMMGTPQMPAAMMHYQAGMGSPFPPAQMPPMGVARPMSQGIGGAMPPPPPPPGMTGPPADRTSQLKGQTSIGLAKPFFIESTVKENLPPPPPDEDSPARESQALSFDEGSPPPPPPPQFDDEDDIMQHPNEDPYALTGPEMFANMAVPDAYVEKVIAIYDYFADKEDELSFTENAVIYVLKKNDDGWYEGILNGKTGLFPGNYVEPCM